ncbi:hypothetical protein F5Y19DRAFT_478862 [Xylariaceae sp. FL1651]|nr:hypothetical protein F5Y19DRAFT_478862 [Xylariaceae sp. FL1651]
MEDNEFSQEREDWKLYPTNLHQPRELKYILKKRLSFLDQNEERLFEPDLECLVFLEVCDGESSRRLVKSLTQLREHLDNGKVDPFCRHVFLRANDSLAPLNCSRESLSYLLTHHQVAPFFLDFLSSFGDTKYPLDYSMTGLQADDTLGCSEENSTGLQRNKHSGREIQTTYLLRSVELVETEGISNRNEARWPWRISHTAVYHSFDVVNGRSFWMSIKGNDVLEKRLTAATSEIPSFLQCDLGDAPAGFRTALATHLIILGWCDENWRPCINEAEDQLRTIMSKVKLTCDENLTTARHSPLPFLVGTSTLQEAGMHSIQDSTVQRASNRQARLLRSRRSAGFMKLFQTNEDSWLPRNAYDADRLAQAYESKFKPGLMSKTSGRQERHLHAFESIKEITLQDQQDLHDLGETLRQMLLVIKLDIEVLRDIREHNANLTTRETFPPEIRKQCHGEITGFFRQLQRIERNLITRMRQLESMISTVQDRQTLWGNILQFQSTRILANTLLERTDKIYELARTANRESSAMLSISAASLIFLPGTILVTLFSTELVQQVDYGVKTPSFFAAFGLFLRASMPLMIIGLATWLWVYYRVTRSQKDRW